MHFWVARKPVVAAVVQALAFLSPVWSAARGQPVAWSAAIGLHCCKVFSLRSLPAPQGPAAIPGCLSSSLPPSIASGRFATFFFSSV
jgi:hypothetical protein